MANKRLPKTTKYQYELLLDFVRNNQVLLSGKTKPLEAKKVTSLWSQFADQVNSSGFGPKKTGEQWRKIFSEWKVNVRRKSRQIEIEKNGTGGGPKSDKTLSDLEERLLSLLSRIHLGDPELPDSFSMCTANSSNQEMGDFDSANEESPALDVKIPQNLTQTPRHENIIFEAIPGSSKITPVPVDYTPRTRVANSTDHNYTTKKSRYTTSLLQEACHMFEEGTRTDMQSKKHMSEALQTMALGCNQVGEALQTMAEVISNYGEVINQAAARIETAIDKSTKVEMLKVKLKYYEVMGTLEGFNEFTE